MRAITVRPGSANSLAVQDLPEPDRLGEELLVEAVALGICGTDREIANGEYGWAPAGRDRLVLGHESLGRVVEAPSGGGFASGDLVAGVVRRPDPVPCPACAHGEWDMCRNGRYQERGIKELDGYGSERWTVEADYAVAVPSALGICGVLVEPTSVVAKAWEQVERVGARAWFDPTSVLVTGAGPIGLLAALLGRQRGLDVHVLDRVTEGRKPELVRDLGATYHHSSVDEVAAKVRPDIVIEATGASTVVIDAIAATGSYGIACLTGVSPRGRLLKVDAGALNRELVLENDVVVGSVNANLRHYRAASEALGAAEISWLRRLITDVIPLDSAVEAMEDRDSSDTVKAVVGFDKGDPAT